jgi:general L-amino acid transport system permease protein
MSTRPPEPTPDEAYAREEEPAEEWQKPARKPPRPPIRAFDWLRRNLFGGVGNTILTLVSLWLLFEALPSLLGWSLFNAQWSGSDPALCRQAEGACWAFIGEKHRFILFGLYPFEEQWRPLLATLSFLFALALSSYPAFWRRWLAGVWALVFVAGAVLMWGGIFGLSFVENAKWGGLPLTLILSVLGIALAFPLSILLALGRRSDMPAIKALCVGFIELIRGVPLISVLFMASVMFPLFLPEGVTIDKLLRALVGITLFTAAYLAEAVRGGLQAIPRGQYEAADALGLSYWKKMGLIILPQALKVSIPSIVNQFISMFKDTSLVIIIGLYDLLTTTQTAVRDPSWRLYYVEGYVFAALLYWAFSFFMSRYSLFLERRLETGLRRA